PPLRLRSAAAAAGARDPGVEDQVFVLGFTACCDRVHDRVRPAGQQESVPLEGNARSDRYHHGLEPIDHAVLQRHRDGTATLAVRPPAAPTVAIHGAVSRRPAAPARRSKGPTSMVEMWMISPGTAGRTAPSPTTRGSSGPRTLAATPTTPRRSRPR